MRRALSTLVAFLAASVALAIPPSEALMDGRNRIAAGDCNGAVAVLQASIPDAAQLTPDKTRNDALSAIHFYTALAFSNCNLPAKAKEEIREFLRFHPGHSALDAKRYPPGFIALFEEVQRSGSGGAPTAFSQHYPDFNNYSNRSPRSEPLPRWGASPEFQIFADDAAHERWGGLRDDEARLRFIADFWSRLDKNEIARRIAYADGQWGNEELRGSLSDRGKVFVLLGVPARVYAKPLTREDGAFIPRRSPLQMDGTLERWVYFREQLPPAVKSPSVEYRFISQAGYGDYVMQKDFWALKALAEAKKAAVAPAE